MLRMFFYGKITSKLGEFDRWLPLSAEERHLNDDKILEPDWLIRLEQQIA